MKNRLLLMAMALAISGAGPAWADTSNPSEPAPSAASTNTAGCSQSGQQADAPEGDPDAPQNRAEYGGGA